MDHTPSKYRSFRAPTDLDDKIEALAESKKKSYSETLIELLNAATRGEDPNRYAWLETSCPALQHLNEGFNCCIKAPIQKKLGDGSNEDAKKVCTSCVAVKGELTQAKILKEQLASGIPADIPYCMNTGGKVRDDLKTVWCPKAGNEIKIGICRTRDNGKPCDYSRIVRVDARPKTS